MYNGYHIDVIWCISLRSISLRSNTLAKLLCSCIRQGTRGDFSIVPFKYINISANLRTVAKLVSVFLCQQLYVLCTAWHGSLFALYVFWRIPVCKIILVHGELVTKTFDYTVPLVLFLVTMCSEIIDTFE